MLNAFPTSGWQRMLRLSGFKPSQTTNWIASELTRGSSRDIAEAGRELGRFDSRPWLETLDVPAAVVVTARDKSVPPRKQRELAQRLGAATFDDQGDHDSVVTRGRDYVKVLLEALAALERARTAVA
jgi:3-oxoadipate enol-lactonase